MYKYISLPVNSTFFYQVLTFVKMSRELSLKTWGDPEEWTKGPPPEKSQVILVSIGKKQLDPTLPLEKVGPPGKLDPLDPLGKRGSSVVRHLHLVLEVPG